MQSTIPLNMRIGRFWVGVCILAASVGCGAGDHVVRTVAPGVSYHRIHLLDGPWWIHVVEVDLERAREEGIGLRTSSASLDRGGVERTSALAKNALAGVNGDFFYTREKSHTAGLLIQDGVLIQAPQRRSALVFSRDGRPLIGSFEAQFGAVLADGRALPISGFNRAPNDEEFTLYNARARSRFDSVRAALGFQLQRIAGRSILNDTVSARVLQLRRQAWPLILDVGQWLVAAGSRAAEAYSITPGDTLKLHGRLPPAQRPLSEAVGGGPRILRDGNVSVEYERERLSRSFAEDRHPRTAVGYTQDQSVLFLVVVDGRQPGYSMGMTLEELAHFMRVRLGNFSLSKENAYQGLNLDGGGSTTMVVKGEVVNSPSDQTGERPVANALIIAGVQ